MKVVFSTNQIELMKALIEQIEYQADAIPQESYAAQSAMDGIKIKTIMLLKHLGDGKVTL